MKNIQIYSTIALFILGFLLLGTNNLNAQYSSCYGATASEMKFTSSGGSLSRAIQIPSGCPGGTWAIIGSPSWLSSVSISGTTVYATSPAYSGAERSGSIYLSINGNSVGGIPVVQNEGYTPPPPPCTITGFSGSNFAGAGQTKNYTLSYSNCPSNIYFTFKQVVNGVEQNLPSWVTVSQPSSTQISVTFAQNSGTGSRNIILIGKRQDGGSPGIGGTFTQDCLQKAWYADSDNDGFRNPGSTAQMDCANRGTGWTLNTTVDVCPTEYSTTNVLKTWYPDSDNDGFRNPTGSSVQQCNKPSGNWTQNATIDQCPDQYSTTNNGCDPDCLSGYIRVDGSSTPPSGDPYHSTEFSFNENGGTAYAEIVFPNGACASPYELVFLDNIDSWATITIEPNNKIKIVSSAYSTNGGTRSTGTRVQIQGTTQIGIIGLNQDGPPLPCTVSGNLTSTFNENGESKTFPLSYSNCSTTTNYNFTLTDGSPLPSWLSVTKNGPDEIILTTGRNDGQSQEIATIVGTATNGSGLSIGGQITLSCNLQTWYKDKDNDGYADSSVTQCSQPNSWYKLSVTGTGDCDDDDPNINPLTVWYEDTDGDNYPDPNGATQTSCTMPTGNWTRTPESVDDQCPNQAAPGPGTNGCDADCAQGYLREVSTGNQPVDITNPYSPLEFEYGEQGGSTTVEIAFPSGVSCAPGFELVIEGPVAEWATFTINPNNTISVSVGQFVSINGSSQNQTGSRIFLNGTHIGILGVKQTGPPVTPTCDLSVTVDGTTLPGTQIDYGVNADIKTIQIVSDPIGCHGEVVFGDYSNGGAPIDAAYLQIGQNQGNNTFNFSTTDNNRGFSVTTYVGIYSYSTGEFLGLFRVVQSSCVDQEWYPDQDNDGSGDVTAVPRYGCTAPTDQPYTYVSNNRDLCPDVPGTAQNQGCPPGSSPENRNTITTWSYDLNTQVKASSKSYFDDLGKLEQTQSWDVKSDSIWASALLYDEFGRPTLQTLSSPIREGLTYQFKEGFIKKSDDVTDYDVTDYDGTNSETPAAVGDAPETLGYYYSDNNTREPYQDVTSYPFSKTVYSELNPGKPLRNLGGNKVNGEWPQSYTFSMKASGELSQTPAFGESGYNTLETTKTVSRDVHGVENVVFMDTDGKVLAAARSGSEGTTSPSMTVTIPEQGFVDIHIAEGITGFTVSNSSAVTVYDLITEAPISGSTSTLGNGFYRVAVNNLDTYVPESIGVTYTVNYYDYSLNEYDEANRLVTSYQPLGATKATKLFSTYEYNTLGQLQRTTSPDEGTAEFKYREDGQIRFSQNSKQKDPNEDGNFADGEFSYTNYDEYGRPVESGVFKEGTITFANADSLLENILEDINEDDDGLLNDDCSEQTFTLYDEQETTGLHAALAASNIPTTDYSEQKFLSGNVSKTFTADTQMATTSWYSYDVYGRVDWMVQNIQNLGTKTIDYKYDPITGLVLEVDYQKDTTSERFVHRYTYNSGDQLTMVETSADGSNFETNATYSYYETGAMKRMELAVDAQGNPVQGVDYVYNLQGQLKSLNHPSLDGANDPGQDTNDLFGMQLDYYGNDYSRTQRTNITSPTYGTDQLNGNIKGIRWKNDAVPGSTNELSYAYDYDRNNWLQSADFNGDGTIGGNEPPLESTSVIENGGTLLLENPTSITLKDGFHAKEGSDVIARIVAGTGSSAIADGDYDVSNISYDANGNILSLKRNKQTVSSSNAMDDLSYNYETGTNKLLQVIDADGDAANADDIDSQPDADNYVYNAIGQLIENKAEGITYTYTTNGLVSTIRKNGLSLVTFFYNDRNHRVRKDTYNGTGSALVQSTYYVRDAAGSVMAIYDSNTLVEQPIYGSGRVAVHNRLDNSSTYELTDHLGNVRAAFAVANGSSNTINATDYYPYGMPMPGRNMLGDYRYAFQGQEKDTETGKEAFELRLWDARIGRWLTTDPYGQFESPYLGMGNDPINYYDYDGGYVYFYGKRITNQDFIALLGTAIGIEAIERYVNDANRHIHVGFIPDKQESGKQGERLAIGGLAVKRQMFLTKQLLRSVSKKISNQQINTFGDQFTLEPGKNDLTVIYLDNLMKGNSASDVIFHEIYAHIYQRDHKGVNSVVDQHFEFAGSPTGGLDTRLEGFSSDGTSETYNYPLDRYNSQKNKIDIFNDINALFNRIFFTEQKKLNRTKVNCDCKR
ncbi:hypothetical protein PP182_19830 [Maribacter sp. PR1]|uniref:RHS repeat-associated core domain-containing protein n=1 Tax=Maribacter cobaltidurans TaxID=1178778 RepID=A0ABU7IZI7_9FLAO|nr:MULTISPECIES: RHS repeat-associated core domain-containing protein [Maribacter]MDC6390946.1 hypothetical protein [Maribacter sp. PR1]MEE1978338.1 RHS repeat-associated core domain-containing protein [Maribacter cobaltidurans]